MSKQFLVAFLFLSALAEGQRVSVVPAERNARGPDRSVADFEVSLGAGELIQCCHQYPSGGHYEGPNMGNDSDGAGRVRVGVVWDRTHYTAIYADADDGVTWWVEPSSTPIVPRMDVYLGDDNRLRVFATSHVTYRGWVFHVGHRSHVYLPELRLSSGGHLVLPDESRVELTAKPPLGGGVTLRSGRGRLWSPLAGPPSGLGCTNDAFALPGTSEAWGPYYSSVENQSTDPNSWAIACLEPNLTVGQPDWLTRLRIPDNFVGRASLTVDGDPAQGPPVMIDLEDDIYMTLVLESPTGPLPQPFIFQLRQNQQIVPESFGQDAPNFLTQGGHLLWMNYAEPPGVTSYLGSQGGPVVITDYQ